MLLQKLAEQPRQEIFRRRHPGDAQIAADLAGQFLAFLFQTRQPVEDVPGGVQQQLAGA